MNDYNYKFSAKDKLARMAANTIVFTGGIGVMWLLAIGTDRLMLLLGI